MEIKPIELTEPDEQEIKRIIRCENRRAWNKKTFTEKVLIFFFDREDYKRLAKGVL